MTSPTDNAGAGGLMLIADDAPELAVLRAALDEAGYAVEPAGADAVPEGVARRRPALVLIDMGDAGAAGVDIARRLGADERTAAIPLILIAGAGVAVDAVPKPVRISLLVERIERELRAARLRSPARSALDAFGHATMIVHARDGRRLWQTALARELLRRHFPQAAEARAPAPVLAWVARESLRRRAGAPPQGLTVGSGPQRLTFAMHAMDAPDGADEAHAPGQPWLIVLREDAEAARIEALRRAFALDPREAELLHGLALGGSDAEIAEGLSLPASRVQGQIQALLGKLGVDSRGAAAALARERMDAAQPRRGVSMSSS